MLAKYTNSINDPFERLFDNFFGKDLFGRELMNRSALSSTREDENSYHVRLDVPGLSSEDVDVSVNGDYLTVIGKDPDTEDHVIRSSYLLSRDVNRNEIKASVKNGRLNIEIPKLKEKQIDVQTIKVT